MEEPRYGNFDSSHHRISAISSVGSCFILSILYVSSLYVWNNEHNRDHPSTIKNRFCSVFVVMLIAPSFVYMFSSKELLDHVPISELMGFRVEGALPATVIPLLLTALLFLGPISVQVSNGTWKTYFSLTYWQESISNLIWLRNHLVAPLSEEFTFRACMMPLILQTFTPMKSVFISPLFFGVAHFHHIHERLRQGIPVGTVVFVSCFQFTYTTIFGFYSAYLFSRTGHFVAPFLAHVFCNHMGFPDVQELINQKGIRRLVLMSLYVLGLVGWLTLMPTVTRPELYSNRLHWRQFES